MGLLQRVTGRYRAEEVIELPAYAIAFDDPEPVEDGPITY